MKKQIGEAEVKKIKNWSPIWIFPIATAFIGAWILFYHYDYQGTEVTLIATNAEGIEGGKTMIKSRSVEIGVVKSTILTSDLKHVKIKVRLNAGMEKLLHDDSIFWIVKPQIGRGGISGLGTLLSGAYIELQPGSKSGGRQSTKYKLLNSPPFATPNSKGIRVILKSQKSGQLGPGDPVFFRGYRVGWIENSSLDPQKRTVNYQLFIKAPYECLVTSNVRFWKDSGITADVTATGMHIKMDTLNTLLCGGISFDIPDGQSLGQPVAEKTIFHLSEDKASIQDRNYADYIDYLMFFEDSIRGLQTGAPVEFRGIRLGTVKKVPFFIPDFSQVLNNDYRIPVLIRIEPGRLIGKYHGNYDIKKYVVDLIMNHGLCGSLKTSNLVTGTLYVDMDFYPKTPLIINAHKFSGYQVIPTVNRGITHLQQSLIDILDKINTLPLSRIVKKATNLINQSKLTIIALQKTLDNANKILINKSIQQLPQDIQETMHEFNHSLQSFQSGSIAYNKMVTDMQRLDRVLRELQLILKALNEKSNALVFEVKNKKDPLPKRAKN